MPDDIAAVCRASPVFSDVPEPELTALATTAREQTYRAREYVFMENDPADPIRPRRRPSRTASCCRSHARRQSPAGAMTWGADAARSWIARRS